MAVIWLTSCRTITLMRPVPERKSRSVLCDKPLPDLRLRARKRSRFRVRVSISDVCQLGLRACPLTWHSLRAVAGLCV